MVGAPHAGALLLIVPWAPRQAKHTQGEKQIKSMFGWMIYCGLDSPPSPPSNSAGNSATPSVLESGAGSSDIEGVDMEEHHEALFEAISSREGLWDSLFPPRNKEERKRAAAELVHATKQQRPQG